MHGCPPGCAHCAHALAQAGVPGLLSDWEDFVRSRDALRLVMLCTRSGRPFPLVSNDDVIQFCVEEACFERLHLAELYAKQAHLNEIEQQGAGGAELQDALAKARAFAKSGVA